jgi:hypothetical protein
MELSQDRKGCKRVAMNKARVESDISNMQVAYDKAIEVMATMLHDTDVDTPAMSALVDSLCNRIAAASPALAVLLEIDEGAKSSLIIGLVQAFYTGTEWGKRPFYEVPAHETCKDPSHHHHKSRLN